MWRRLPVVLLPLLLLPAATVGTIAFMSPKGLRTIEDDGAALTSIGKDLPAPQEDNCGMAVDMTRRLVIWSEGYYDPVTKQAVGKIWRLSLDATATELPVLVASGAGMRLLGLVINPATESVYVSRYFSSKGGYYIYKVDAYSTAADETISDATHKWASFKGGEQGGGMAISGGFLYLPTAQDGSSDLKLLYRLQLSQPAPASVDTIKTLADALQPDDFLGSIAVRESDGVLLIGTSDVGKFPGVVYEYNAATDSVTNLYDGIVPEFVTSRPRTPGGGAPLPNIASVSASPGSVVLGSNTGIDVVTLGAKPTNIYTSAEGNLGPFVYYTGTPPTAAPKGSGPPPTDAPAVNDTTAAPVDNNSSATGAPESAAPSAPPTDVQSPPPDTFVPMPPSGTPPPGAAEEEEDSGGDSGLVTLLVICLTLVALCLAGGLIYVYMQRSKDKRAAQEAMAQKDGQITALLQNQKNGGLTELEEKEPAPLPPPPMMEARRSSLAMNSPRASLRGLAPSEFNMSAPNFSISGSTNGRSAAGSPDRMGDYPLIFWPGLQSAQPAQAAPSPAARASYDHAASPLYHRILAMYDMYNPTKIHTVDALVEKYGEEALLKTLVDKYGAEPDAALQPHFDSTAHSVHLSPVGSPAASPVPASPVAASPIASSPPGSPNYPPFVQ
ncbi:hypothetical protein DIPPA_13617 [Diplonema papillatum]|nr:hypothetical protein DIPPA_13617 [Diplonema papillatum]